MCLALLEKQAGHSNRLQRLFLAVFGEGNVTYGLIFVKLLSTWFECLVSTVQSVSRVEAQEHPFTNDGYTFLVTLKLELFHFSSYTYAYSSFTENETTGDPASTTKFEL